MQGSDSFPNRFEFPKRSDFQVAFYKRKQETPYLSLWPYGDQELHKSVVSVSPYFTRTTEWVNCSLNEIPIGDQTERI